MPEPRIDPPADPYREALERLEADGTVCPDCGDYASILSRGWRGEAEVLCVCSVCRCKFYVNLRHEADPDRRHDKED